MLTFTFTPLKLALLITLLSIHSISLAKVISASPVLKVGFMSSIKRLDNGNYVGALPDIMRETIARTPYSLSLQAMPIKRLLKSLEVGKLDAVIGLFKRDSRLKYSYYLKKPIGWVCANMFTVQSDTSITDVPSSLYQKNIGLLRGANWGEELKQMLVTQQTNQTQVSDYNMLAKMLIKGRFDAVIASSDAFKSAMRKQSFNSEFVATPLKNSPNLGMYILVSKQSKFAQNSELVHVLNNTLDAMSNENRFRTIYQRNGKTFDEHCKV